MDEKYIGERPGGCEEVRKVINLDRTDGQVHHIIYRKRRLSQEDERGLGETAYITVSAARVDGT